MNKKLLTNYHTHSTFCDGKNSPQEMAKSAFEKGVDILGFSSHSIYPFSDDWHISANNFDAYCAEIFHLKAEYSGKMQVLLGFEADFIPGITFPKMSDYAKFSPDYLIGAVHFVGTNDGIFAIDGSDEELLGGIKKYFKGNGKDAVCEYFARQREMLKIGNFAILAHCDLVRKSNWRLNYFDENSSWYKNELKATAKEIEKSGVIVEINCGAIFRGSMDDVYPSAEFLQMLNERSVPITFSSDAHNAEGIVAKFDRAELAARKAGYSEIMYINEKGQALSQPL